MSELYKLPKGWEWKKLSDIGKISTGKTPPKSNKEFYENGTIRFVKPPNLQNTSFITILENDEFVTKNGAEKSLLLPKNSLMVCCIGSLGKFALTDEEVITNQQINSIIFNEDIMYYKFGYYYGFMFEKLLNNVANEAVVKIVNKSIFSNIHIPLPPLEEQKRIVEKLDLLFAKIDKATQLHQKNCEEADIFMASVLNDVFEELEEKYQFEKIGNLSKTTSGGTPKRNEKTYWNGNIGWLKSGELNDGYITEVEEFITEIGVNKSSAKLFPKGTLLIAMYGATVGKLGILEIETTTNQAICGILNDKNKFEIKYMFYFLKENREKMVQDSFGGAQPNISQAYIRELEVPLPTLETQQKVVLYLDEVSSKIEKIKELQKSKMQSLKELKASILDKAFKGEL